MTVATGMTTYAAPTVGENEGKPGSTPVQDEIAAVQELLGHYGFSFWDLAECSPKAEKTKAACAKVVVELLKDPELFQKMRTSKSLPVKELLAMTKVQKKILERHRRYIIAAAAVLLLCTTGVYSYNNVVASSYVSLDADTSIEYTLNRKNQVLDVTALNEEAEKIVQFFFDIPESGNLSAYFFLVS